MPNRDDSSPAVFLDRDGTLMEEVGFCGDPAAVRVFPGVVGALERLRQAGFKLIIVTNQSGIAQGYFTEADYHRVHAEFLRQIDPVRIDGAYFCADDPKNPTHRRKPNPGMLLDAAREHGIDLSRSYTVGDRAGDIGAGRAAGTKTVLVKTGYGQSHLDSQPDWIAEDFSAAAAWILGERT